jgi:hypothetical protein
MCLSVLRTEGDIEIGTKRSPLTCNVDITKDKIVGRIKTFDKHYEIISKMLAQSGFGWDSENNMVEVDSDEVWSRYVEVLNIVIKFCELLLQLDYHF